MAKTKKTPGGWENRIVESGAMPAHQFLAHDLNARRHPNKQREALRGSLNAVGWVAPVIVSARTGKLLDGHARIEEALTEDEQQAVPFVKVNVSEAEERLILASFDPIAGMASYDREVLDLLLRETTTGEASLQSLLSELAQDAGLYREKLDFLSAADDGEPQAEPEPQQQSLRQDEAKFPLAIVLTARQHRQWQEYKQQAGVTSDTQAFLDLWQNQ